MMILLMPCVNQVKDNATSRVIDVTIGGKEGSPPLSFTNCLAKYSVAANRVPFFVGEGVPERMCFPLFECFLCPCFGYITKYHICNWVLHTQVNDGPKSRNPYCKVYNMLQGNYSLRNYQAT